MNCKECQRTKVEASFVEFRAVERERQIVLGALSLIAAAFAFGIIVGSLIF